MKEMMDVLPNVEQEGSSQVEMITDKASVFLNCFEMSVNVLEGSPLTFMCTYSVD